MMEYRGIKIRFLGHDGFQLLYEDYVIYIDPYKLTQTDLEKADIVIASHDHGDHCSPKDIKQLLNQDSIIITVKQAEDKVKDIGAKEVKIVEPGKVLEIGKAKFEFVPAYNINKFRTPGNPFHPKESKYIGVIVEINDTRIYHAGDTDHIPEMKEFEVDIALLPVSGTYVMTADEAVDAATILNRNSSLKFAIPMHYGEIVGSEEMAERFKEKASCEVIILEKK